MILEDGRTVSPAINVQPLTTDLALVKTSLDNLPYKKYFTNMAQAFALAEVMYTGAGCRVPRAPSSCSQMASRLSCSKQKDLLETLDMLERAT